MLTAPVINSALSTFILALTPAQRWEAAGKFNNSSFSAQYWIVLIGVIAVIILMVLLLIVSFNRTKQNKQTSDQLFIEYAKKRGLTTRERQILLNAANKAGLKRNESIFTLATAFDQGSAEILEEQQASEESDLLSTELSFLREKLGFKKRPVTSIGALTKPEKLSSRQIPIGKKVYVTRRRTRGSDGIESTVIKNSDFELAIRLAKPVEIAFGEPWCVCYYFGSSVWEFETSVVSYDGNILVLNHSYNIRFINRRRFLRVAAKKPAFIARFPFTRTLDYGTQEKSTQNQDSTKTFPVTWAAPEFVPAVVTELAGPGLRIETTLEVEVGQRVLVVFSLEEEQNRDSTAVNTGALKIVEDIGEVKHTRTIPNGWSIAVELTGLRDSDIDELIRATNEASVKMNAKNEKAAASAGSEEGVSLPVGAQGV